MFVKVEIQEWAPFPGSSTPLPNGLPSVLKSVEVFSHSDLRIEEELKEKLYLQHGAVPVRMKFIKQGD